MLHVDKHVLEKFFFYSKGFIKKRETKRFGVGILLYKAVVQNPCNLFRQTI